MLSGFSEWISAKGKYFLILVTAVLAASFAFMDSSGLQSNESTMAATVNGWDITSQELYRAVNDQKVQYRGQNLSRKDEALLKENVLQSLISRRLMSEKKHDNEIVASKYEMFQDLLANPPEGLKAAPIFMIDSINDKRFDTKKYEEWLRKEETYSIPEIKQYETYLRDEKIPMAQLQAFVSAGMHQSDLEAAFTVERTQNKFKAKVLWTPFSKYTGEEATEETARSYFEKNSNKYLQKQNLYKLALVEFKLLPSLKDEEEIKGYAELLKTQITEGAPFEEVAAGSSEDDTSKDKGGLLGDLSLNAMHPEIAKVVQTLDSGSISSVIKTSEGFHIVKSNGPGQENPELYSVSQILIKIAIGNSTLDSLRKLADQISNTTGNNALALTPSVKVDTTDFIKAEAGEIAKLGYFGDLKAWVQSKESKASKPMENDERIVVIQVIETVTQGSANFEISKAEIMQELKKESRKVKASAYIEGVVAKLTPEQDLAALIATDEKLKLDTTAWLHADSYVPGLGRAQGLEVVIATEKGKWSKLVSGLPGVGRFLVQDVEKVNDASKAILVSKERTNSEGFLASRSLEEWFANVQKGAEIRYEVLEQ
jgi:hypothetical protein